MASKGTTTVSVSDMESMATVAAELRVKYTGSEQGPQDVRDWMRLVFEAYVFRFEYPFKATRLKYLHKRMTGRVSGQFERVLQAAVLDRVRDMSPHDVLFEVVCDHMVAGGILKKTMRLVKTSPGMRTVYTHPRHVKALDGMTGDEGFAYQESWRRMPECKRGRKQLRTQLLERQFEKAVRLADGLVVAELGESASLAKSTAEEPVVVKVDEVPRLNMDDLGIRVVRGGSSLTLGQVSEAVSEAQASLVRSQTLLLENLDPEVRPGVARALSSASAFLGRAILERLS